MQTGLEKPFMIVWKWVNYGNEGWWVRKEKSPAVLFRWWGEVRRLYGKSGCRLRMCPLSLWGRVRRIHPSQMLPRDHVLTGRRLLLTVRLWEILLRNFFSVMSMSAPGGAASHLTTFWENCSITPRKYFAPTSLKEIRFWISDLVWGISQFLLPEWWVKEERWLQQIFNRKC